MYQPVGMVKSHCLAPVLITPVRFGSLEVPGLALIPQKALLCGELFMASNYLQNLLTAAMRSCCCSAGMSKVSFGFEHAHCLAEPSFSPFLMGHKLLAWFYFIAPVIFK